MPKQNNFLIFSKCIFLSKLRGRRPLGLKNGETTATAAPPPFPRPCAYEMNLTFLPEYEMVWINPLAVA